MSSWRSKYLNKKTAHKKYRVPRWTVNLDSDEVFVNKVPSLSQIAAASIVGNQLFFKFDNIEQYIFDKCATDVIIEVVFDEVYDRITPSYYIKTISAHNIDALSLFERKTIAAALPYIDYNIIKKKDLVYLPHEQPLITREQRRKQLTCVKRLFD